MGTNVSKQNNKSLTDVVSESIAEVQVDVSNSTTSSSYSYQNINIDLSGSSIGTITVTQISDITTKALLNSDANIISELSSKLSTKATDNLKATLTQANEKLNIGQTNIGIVNQEVEKNIKNNIKQLIKTGISNASIVATRTDQGMFIRAANAKIGNIVLTQESLIKSISESISKTIAND